jgi:hypothetical protein
VTHTRISREHVNNSLTVDSDHAFALRYCYCTTNMRGKTKLNELMLKQSCCGKYWSANYIADIHFTTKMIYTYITSEQTSGRSISIMVDSILTLMKKALSLVSKLVSKIVNIDSSLKVVGYASG